MGIFKETNPSWFFNPEYSSLKEVIIECANYLSDANALLKPIQTLNNFENLKFTSYDQVFTNLNSNFIMLKDLILHLKYFKKILDKKKETDISDNMYIEIKRLVEDLDKLFFEMKTLFKKYNLKFWENKRKNALAHISKELIETNAKIKVFIITINELSKTARMLKTYFETGKEFIGDDLKTPDFGDKKIK